MKFTPLLVLCLSVCLASPSMGRAQTEKFPTAPRPSQLGAAKKVFLSNASNFAGVASDQIYDQVYAAVQNLNRFSLVGTPQEADLIVEFSAKDLTYIATLIDPRTHATLWSVSETPEPAARQATITKNQQTAIDRLAADIARITTPAPA